MSLEVKILGLDQKSSVDFNDGSVTQANFLQIALPGGEVVLALVDDAVAQKILLEVQSAKKVLKEQPTQNAQPAARVAFAPRPAVAQQPPAFEFGGTGDIEEFDDEEDEPVVPPQYGPQLTKVRALGADDAGNPVDAAGVPIYQKAPPQEEAVMDEDGVRGL